LNSYKKYNEEGVVNDLENNGYKIVTADLIDNAPVEKTEVDVLYRSILRHDSKKVAKVLEKIFNA